MAYQNEIEHRGDGASVYPTNTLEAVEQPGTHIIMLPDIYTSEASKTNSLWAHFDLSRLKRNLDTIRNAHLYSVDVIGRRSVMPLIYQDTVHNVIPLVTDIFNKYLDILTNIASHPLTAESFAAILGVQNQPTVSSDERVGKIMELLQGEKRDLFLTLSPTHDGTYDTIEALSRMGIDTSSIGVIMLDKHSDLLKRSSQKEAEMKKNGEEAEVRDEGNFARLLIERNKVRAIASLGLRPDQYEGIISGNVRSSSPNIREKFRRTHEEFYNKYSDRIWFDSLSGLKRNDGSMLTGKGKRYLDSLMRWFTTRGVKVIVFTFDNDVMENNFKTGRIAVPFCEINPLLNIAGQDLSLIKENREATLLAIAMGAFLSPIPGLETYKDTLATPDEGDGLSSGFCLDFIHEIHEAAARSGIKVGISLGENSPSRWMGDIVEFAGRDYQQNLASTDKEIAQAIIGQDLKLG